MTPLPSADTAAVDEAVKAEDLFEEAGEMGLEEDALDSAAIENPFLSLLVGGASNILVPAKNKANVNRIIHSLDVQKSMPNDLEFRWANAEEDLEGAPEPMWALYLVKKELHNHADLICRHTFSRKKHPDMKTF